MLKEILSTGVAVMISGSLAPATTVRSDGGEPISQAREFGESRLKTFVVLDDRVSDGTLRCSNGYEAPDGGVFFGPVPD